MAASSCGHALIVIFTLILVTAVAVTACSRRGKDESQKLSKRVVEYGQPVPKGGGRYKVGNPYRIGGRLYTPRENPSYDKTGVASWYGELFHGRYTANGEIFDMDALTAAHTTLPLLSYVRVTNLQNGRSLVLRVNDRGPYAHDRIIDLSRRSARALGFERMGTAKVRVRYLGRAPLNGDDSLERRVYASQPWANRSMASAGRPAPSGPVPRVGIMRTSSARQVADPMTVASIPDEEKAGADQADWSTTAHDATAGGEGKASVFIQAASFKNRDFAHTLQEKLADLGEAKVLATQVGGETWYRVRLGPYARRHAADEALRAVVISGVTDARIVRN